ALPDAFVDQQLSFADGLPFEMKSSMLNDLVAGNRLEAPWLSGAVARMAKESGLAAPVSATLYAAVKPFSEGRRYTMRLLLVWLINAAALMALPYLLSSITVDSIPTALIAAL